MKKKRFSAWLILPAFIVFIILGALGRYMIIRSTYPVKFQPLVIAASHEFGIKPALLASVMLVESGCNPKAVSEKGAIGLTQIMPDTGKWIAKKLKLSSYSDLSLNDPATNLRISAWYLSFLLQRYDQNQRTAIAAYHAGQHRVDGWLADQKNLYTLTNIPILETDLYVKRVQEAYPYYVAFYSSVK